MTSIAILDYGVGNLFSLGRALEKAGGKPEVIPSIPEPFSFHGLILPGVGNFAPVAQRLQCERTKIQALIEQRVPVLGICLGMQLLFDSSEEGAGEGLGFFSGKVKRLPNDVKVPHIGWNQLQAISGSLFLAGLDQGCWVYYVHSYYPEPNNPSIVVARSEYGVTFASVVEKGLMFGAQFHPEKSGDAGARMIRNFVDVARPPNG